MKKLIIKIGNETHELPYNGEVFSFEISEKYVPKVGDCVKISFKDSKFEYFGKISQIVKKEILLKSSVNEISRVILNLSLDYDYPDMFLKEITPEELKAKYAEVGYDWDYESDTVEPIKWMPKEGDCVRADITNSGCAAFFKIVSINNDGNIKSEHCVDLYKGEYTVDLCDFEFLSEIKFTQITPEELKAKYAKAGYDWDYETNEVKSIKRMPKDGDKVWFYSLLCEVVSYIFDKDSTMLQLLAEKGLLFPTEAECQKFADHCLQYFDKK